MCVRLRKCVFGGACAAWQGAHTMQSEGRQNLYQTYNQQACLGLVCKPVRISPVMQFTELTVHPLQKKSV